MATSATSAINAANSIGIEDFLKILTAQLNNQDPLKPLDNQEFLSQIAQFSSLQQSQQLNEKMALLVSTQSSVQSVGLLNKNVTFTENTIAKSGVVAEISFSTSGVPTFAVTVAGQATPSSVSLSQISKVK